MIAIYDNNQIIYYEIYVINKQILRISRRISSEFPANYQFYRSAAGPSNTWRERSLTDKRRLLLNEGTKTANNQPKSRNIIKNQINKTKQIKTSRLSLQSKQSKVKQAEQAKQTTQAKS